MDRSDVHQAADQFALSWDVSDSQPPREPEGGDPPSKPTAEGEDKEAVRKPEVVLMMQCLVKNRSRRYASRCVRLVLLVKSKAALLYFPEGISTHICPVQGPKQARLMSKQLTEPAAIRLLCSEDSNQV